MSDDETPRPQSDADPEETREWLDSLEYVFKAKGADRATYLFERLRDRLGASGAQVSAPLNTPYINTIPAAQEPPYPGNLEIERRIRSLIRWNAMAMVVKANKQHQGIGGHISTFASAATLYEVAFNHFLHGKDAPQGGDQVYFQGHGAPGVYARSYVEGRLPEEALHHFRREVSGAQGLSSYPHPWLLPDYWEFPTVSMGLAPIMSIYQARFNRYLHDRGLKDTSAQRVWAFVGDGETDEPESLGAITLASRERLDNLIWVVNCNLQRLDGPVRGNGKIIQELEAIFRGAGWNVIKVIWGRHWDPLLAQDDEGLLVKRMGEVVDGWYQKYTVEGGAFARTHFFGADPRLLKLVETYSDEQIHKMLRGGHDPRKVYAAYKAAIEHRGQPTVILAKTIKGYGLGEAGEGRNITHQQKKMNEHELREFDAAARAGRDRAAEGEPGERERQPRMRLARMLDHPHHVVGLAAPLVVRALGRAHAAEIEAQRRRAGFREGARDRRHHLVVHRAAEERMRMGDHRHHARHGGVGSRDLDAAGRALDEGAIRRDGHQMSRRSTTRPWTRCSSMISSMSSLSTYVYQTSSGYTTMTGPSSQRSRQPALLMRTRPGPDSPSALIRSLAY